MNITPRRIEIAEGINLNILETDKFKSNLLSFYFTRPLARREITQNALIPLVLKRGSENFTTSLDIDKKLEELFGASLGIGISKRGEKQVIKFQMEWATEKYTKESSLDEDAINMLKEIVFNPLLENNSFKSEYVNQEKKNLENIIKSRVNNKRSYAIDRCIESMCKNERFGHYPLGYAEDIFFINEENLYEQYKNMIETSPIEIFFVGKISNDIVEYFEDLKNINRKELVHLREDVVIKSNQTKNMVKEALDVSQGKLVLGYRSGIKSDDPLYGGLVLANLIFGGGPKSKLFENVREKESLAYYINSSLYKAKSIIILDAGIKFEDFDKVIKLVNEELKNLKDGDITDSELNIAKKTAKSSLESLTDSQYSITEFSFNEILASSFRTLDDIMALYENVEKEEIIKAAQSISLDTIYFLQGMIE